MSTPAFTYESATDQAYNAGVVRVPHLGDVTGVRSYREDAPIWGDVLGDKDVVGGQVLKDFKAIFGTPVKMSATLGVYEKVAAYTETEGLLLLSTDAYDGPRQINVVKGGTVRTDIGALAALSDPNLVLVATALNARYDAKLDTIKI